MDSQRKFVNDKGVKQTDKHAQLYLSLMLSEAFKSLNKSEQMLLVYMIAETYNKKLTDQNLGVDAFYFNRAIQEKWNTSTGTRFIKHRNKLMDRGFIRFIENNHHRGQKNIYELCEGWKTWKKEEK